MQDHDIAHNKLLMLYSLDRVGPMNSAQALRFVVENGLAGYIDAQLSLAELVEDGMLALVQQEGTSVYRFTQAGRRALELLSGKLKSSTKALVNDRAPVWATVVKSERQLSAEFSRDGAGEYVVSLRVYEKGAALLSLDVRVPERAHAEKACEVFKSNPGGVLSGVLELLLS